MNKEYDIRVRSVHDYNSFIGATDTTSLVSVIHYDSLLNIRHCRALWGVYGLFLLEDNLESLSYGHGHYNYRSGSLVCVAPGQIGGVYDDGTTFERRGWALLFHPDLFQGTCFEKELRRLEFFSYHINEALPMSGDEKNELVEVMELLQKALIRRGESNMVIGKYVELLLTLCSMLYKKHFPTSLGIKSGHIVTRMEQVLSTYYDRQEQLKHGIPSVNICADRMCISSNYLGDLIKQETGDSAIHFIGKFIIQKAKEMMMDGNSVTNTAYSLGFDYPSHLARLFKRIEGITPSMYLKNIAEEKVQ